NAAGMEAGDSQLPQSNKPDKRWADLQAKSVSEAPDKAPKNKDWLAKSESLKTRSNSLSGKKFFAAEIVKINQKTDSSSGKRKSAGASRTNEEKRLPALQVRKLETKIAGQIEKVELLLRSFRNARANETVEGFDVEYEKKQARKLLGINAQLRRESEDYGISYAEELLSRVEPYLLEIANLGTNPSADTVLDIKERVNSQNIIASLQVYSRDAAQ
ncbi:MAG TPA: hypothetical protein VGC97_00645, partial [Pyrinomonadaceae bacterium]